MQCNARWMTAQLLSISFLARHAWCAGAIGDDDYHPSLIGERFFIFYFYFSPLFQLPPKSARGWSLVMMITIYQMHSSTEIFGLLNENIYHLSPCLMHLLLLSYLLHPVLLLNMFVAGLLTCIVNRSSFFPYALLPNADLRHVRAVWPVTTRVSSERFP